MISGKQINNIGQRHTLSLPTTVLHRPMCAVEAAKQCIEQVKKTYPLYISAVKAAAPSMMGNNADQYVNLNTYLINHPSATYFLTILGDSMVNAGIFNGDLLIVDRSLDAVSGKIVIVSVNGELAAKRLYKTSQGVFLVAENCAYSAIELDDSAQIQIRGVVICTIRAIGTAQNL